WRPVFLFFDPYTNRSNRIGLALFFDNLVRKTSERPAAASSRRAAAYLRTVRGCGLGGGAVYLRVNRRCALQAMTIGWRRMMPIWHPIPDRRPILKQVGDAGGGHLSGNEFQMRVDGLSTP